MRPKSGQCRRQRSPLDTLASARHKKTHKSGLDREGFRERPGLAGCVRGHVLLNRLVSCRTNGPAGHPSEKEVGVVSRHASLKIEQTRLPKE